MGTKANPGDFDCYAALEPDEPYFLLKATDVTAPQAVRFWAQAYEYKKQRENRTGPVTEFISEEPLTIRQQRKYNEAMACASAMEKWRASWRAATLEKSNDG